MTNNHDIFISYKRKGLSLVHDSWFMVQESWLNQTAVTSSFSVPLVLLWLSYRALEWIRGKFDGHEEKYAETDISELSYEASLLDTNQY